MVLTVYFVISPAIGLSCHRHWRDAKATRQLDAAVEAWTTRLRRPQNALSSAARVASIASRTDTRDDRETPLCGDGTRRILPVIWGRDQLRQIGTTGKSPRAHKMLSSVISSAKLDPVARACIGPALSSNGCAW